MSGVPAHLTSQGSANAGPYAEGPRGPGSRTGARLKVGPAKTLSGGTLGRFVDWLRLWTENPGKKRKGDGVLGTHNWEPRLAQRPERSDQVTARRWGWRQDPGS